MKTVIFNFSFDSLSRSLNPLSALSILGLFEQKIALLYLDSYLVFSSIHESVFPVDCFDSCEQFRQELDIWDVFHFPLEVEMNLTSFLNLKAPLHLNPHLT